MRCKREESKISQPDQEYWNGNLTIVLHGQTSRAWSLTGQLSRQSASRNRAEAHADQPAWKAVAWRAPELGRVRVLGSYRGQGAELGWPDDHSVLGAGVWQKYAHFAAGTECPALTRTSLAVLGPL
jgi:hypothetical protein